MAPTGVGRGQYHELGWLVHLMYSPITLVSRILPLSRALHCCREVRIMSYSTVTLSNSASCFLIECL